MSTEHEAQISALENQVQYYDDLMKQHPDYMLSEPFIDVIVDRVVVFDEAVEFVFSEPINGNKSMVVKNPKNIVGKASQRSNKT